MAHLAAAINVRLSTTVTVETTIMQSSKKNKKNKKVIGCNFHLPFHNLLWLPITLANRENEGQNQMRTDTDNTVIIHSYIGRLC